MNERDVKIITVKWLIGIMNSLMLCLIGFMFTLSFIYPQVGTRYIIFAAIALLLIGILFTTIHFLERKNESSQFALSGLHRFLAVSIKFILTSASGAALLFSLGFYLFSGTVNYLLNGGCFIAFTMIIILIELFIRIILPLTGVEQEN